MTREIVNIVVGGDLCPIGINLPYFSDGDVQSIFNDLLVDFEKADLTIFNLECPLIDQKSPILKCGPVLGVESSSINGLKAAKIDVVNLANNHIMDHGPKGLINTIKVCADNGIATVGAGENLESARRILIRDVGGIRIGILGVAEHEFSIATNKSYGANPFDLIDYVRNLNNNKSKFDYLIVLFHGGNEYYPLPSPRVKNVCQFMVEMGANAVIMQHSHCAGSIQEYKGSQIVYGQGNLIFDSPETEKAFHEGFLVKLSIDHHLRSKMKIIPYVQSLNQPGARRMKKDEEKVFLQQILKRSSSVKDDSILEAQWLEYCEKKKNSYVSRLFGHNYFFRKLVTKGFFTRLFCTKESLLRLQNTINCEAHREILETLFHQRMI